MEDNQGSQTSQTSTGANTNAGTETGTGTGTQTGTQNTQTQSETATEKAIAAFTAKLDAVSKSFEKSTGVSAETLKNAAAGNGAGSAADGGKITELEKEIAELKNYISAAETEKKQTKARESVAAEVLNAGISEKTLKLFLKANDPSQFVSADGKVDAEKAKKAAADFLAEYPELKAAAQKKPFVRVGADGNEEQQTETYEEKIAKAMGIRPKK